MNEIGVAIVETPLDFLEVQVKGPLGDDAVMEEPVFRKGPEAFDAVYMVPAERFTPVFRDDDMIAPDIQEYIGMTVVGEMQASRAVCSEQKQRRVALCPPFHGESPDFSLFLPYPADEIAFRLFKSGGGMEPARSNSHSIRQYFRVVSPSSWT